MMQLVTNIPETPLTEIYTCRIRAEIYQSQVFCNIFHDQVSGFAGMHHSFFQATIYLESGFLFMFSKKYVLQMFKNVMNVKKPQ